MVLCLTLYPIPILKNLKTQTSPGIIFYKNFSALYPFEYFVLRNKCLYGSFCVLFTLVNFLLHTGLFD